MGREATAASTPRFGVRDPCENSRLQPDDWNLFVVVAKKDALVKFCWINNPSKSSNSIDALSKVHFSLLRLLRRFSRTRSMLILTNGLPFLLGGMLVLMLRTRFGCHSLTPQSPHNLHQLILLAVCTTQPHHGEVLQLFCVQARCVPRPPGHIEAHEPY